MVNDQQVEPTSKYLGLYGLIYRLVYSPVRSIQQPIISCSILYGGYCMSTSTVLSLCNYVSFLNIVFNTVLIINIVFDIIPPTAVSATYDAYFLNIVLNKILKVVLYI